MAYRKLTGIDEKIILAIWQLGAADGARKVTARKVGALCGVSDYTVFCHFGRSNRGFLDAAAQHFFSQHLEPLLDFVSRGGTVEEIWDSVLDSLLSEINGTLYFKSYYASFGPGNLVYAPETRVQADAALALACGSESYGHETLLLDHFLSCAFTYAEYFSRKPEKNTPEACAFLRSLVCSGLSSIKNL